MVLHKNCFYKTQLLFFSKMWFKIVQMKINDTNAYCFHVILVLHEKLIIFLKQFIFTKAKSWTANIKNLKKIKQDLIILFIFLLIMVLNSFFSLLFVNCESSGHFLGEVVEWFPIELVMILSSPLLWLVALSRLENPVCATILFIVEER